MKRKIIELLAVFTVITVAVALALPAIAADKKPNIMFIMGDDIGLYKKLQENLVI